MRELAICKSSGRLYQGNSNSGAPVIGHAVLLPIEFIGADIKPRLDEFSGYAGLMFREDSFDPITKIRRGRVYALHGNQPATWRVQDPTRKDLEYEPWAGGAAQKIEVISYYAEPLNPLRGLNQMPKVALGEEPFMSFWKILAVEKQLDGAPLLTLKAIQSLGVVPELLEHQIPDNARQPLKQAIQRVEASANRLGPVDTIDRCRDALSVVFGALVGNPNLDLGEGIKKYIKTNQAKNGKGDGQNLVSHNAEVVRRLHPRGKPNEQERHGTRSVTDEDADLALSCLWFVLIELEWAKG